MADGTKCDRGSADKGSMVKKGTVGPSCGSKPSVEPPVFKKPQLRGLHMLQTRNHLIIGITLSTAVALAFKFLVFDPKKVKYAEYYRTTDMEDLFEKMRKSGIFQGAP